MHSVNVMTDYSRHTLGNGSPLALAHGAGGSVLDNFGELASYFPSRQLIGTDYPGSGDRPASESKLRLEQLADEVVAAMESAGHERFPVLGLSLGSAVAVTAAIRHPERVTALILTVGFGVSDAQSITFSRLFAELARGGRMDDLARFLILLQAPGFLAGLDPDALAALEDQVRANVTAQGSSRVPQIDLASRVDVRDLLPRITVPTLVIAAGQDRIVLPSSTRSLAAAIPGAQLVELDEAGHIFSGRETEIWAQHISEFLEKVEK